MLVPRFPKRAETDEIAMMRPPRGMSGRRALATRMFPRTVRMLVENHATVNMELTICVEHRVDLLHRDFAQNLHNTNASYGWVMSARLRSAEPAPIVPFSTRMWTSVIPHASTEDLICTPTTGWLASALT